MVQRLFVTVILLYALTSLQAQQADLQISNLANFPGKFLERMQQQSKRLDDHLTHETEKYLSGLEKEERKLKRRLCKTDSAAAKDLFDSSINQYQALHNRLRYASPDSNSTGAESMLFVDSIKNALIFLNTYPSISQFSPTQLGASLSSFNRLKSRMEAASAVKSYVRERQQQLKETVSRYNKWPGLNKYLQGYNKQAYYYCQQFQELKNIVNEPDKMARKALTLLNQLPAFQDFLKHNGELAGLFRMPGNYGSVLSLQGLQTRDQLNQLIQDQTGTAGSGGMAVIQSNLSSAREQIDRLKSKIEAPGSSRDLDMPDFKPNDQKTKSFLKRLEPGFSLQNHKSNSFFPKTTDIGLSAGYRFNNYLTAGTGVSCKLGWGTGVNHISISSQGVGLRTFFDLKIRSSLYASGGLEYNYQQPFTNVQQLPGFNAWQRSGLIGVTKKMSINNKLVKKTNLQLLWDFLSYYQRPKTESIKFRVGYALR